MTGKLVHPVHKERRSGEDIGIREYFHGSRRFYDKHEHCEVVKIFAGDWYATNKGEMLATILGSCVSACVRDPVIGAGGMNHFLLPGNETNDSEASDAARYGVFAMESLLNGVFKLGGRKERLEIKVFGGGNVLKNSVRIGSKNAQFIRDFLRREGYRIVTEDLEGEHPRRLHYYPATGKVMMRLLMRKEDNVVADEEAAYSRKIIAKPVEGDIELF
jgi:chemotaxis protein CheD